MTATSKKVILNVWMMYDLVLLLLISGCLFDALSYCFFFLSGFNIYKQTCMMRYDSEIPGYDSVYSTDRKP